MPDTFARQCIEITLVAFLILFLFTYLFILKRSIDCWKNGQKIIYHLRKRRHTFSENFCFYLKIVKIHSFYVYSQSFTALSERENKNDVGLSDRAIVAKKKDDKNGRR